MEDIAKNFYVQLGAIAALIGILVYIILRSWKKEDEKDTTIKQLGETYIAASEKRAIDTTTAIATNTATNEKVADILERVEAKLGELEKGQAELKHQIELHGGAKA